MAENTSFESIMREISGRLTGDSGNDIEYLHEQMDKYKDHEYSKEIIRACGRMMYEILPEDKKAEINELIRKDGNGIEA